MTKLLTIICVGALGTQLVSCGLHGGSHYYKGHTHHTNTVPTVIEESEKVNQCPVGFQWLGKECIKTISTQPETTCPFGFVHLSETGKENQCAKYTSKTAFCPSGYVRNGGVCRSIIEKDYEIVCPESYTLDSEINTCTREVPLPPIFYCPEGTVEKGDSCVSEARVEPQFVCPTGYILENKRCFSEEIYDCTPETSITSPHKRYHGKLRLLGHADKHYKIHYAPKVITTPDKPISMPTVEDHIIQQTCKRTRYEDARKICPVGSFLVGKSCQSEERSPLLTRPGGFKQERVPVQTKCKPEYSLTTTTRGMKCLHTLEVMPEFRCPDNTQQLGEKCAIFKLASTYCPQDYKLDPTGRCTKIIRQPAIVEYSVKYSCVGKDCGNNPSSHHHEKI